MRKALALRTRLASWRDRLTHYLLRPALGPRVQAGYEVRERERRTRTMTSCSLSSGLPRPAGYLWCLALCGSLLPAATTQGGWNSAAVYRAVTASRTSLALPRTPAGSPSDPGDPVAVAARGGKVTDAAAWASFALIDRLTGRIVGDSRSSQPTNVESLIKVWLAADLLSTFNDEIELLPWRRALMARMIRYSDDEAAEKIYRSLGRDSSIRRMIATCRLTDTTVHSGWWSLTQMSARDMARLGSCVAPGPHHPLSDRAGAELLGLMRSVVPSGAFGIPAAEPAGHGVEIAVKNGWTEHGRTGLWNVNCLGMWGPGVRWVLAVTTRYPRLRGLAYGADICARVTRALFRASDGELGANPLVEGKRLPCGPPRCVGPV